MKIGKNTNLKLTQNFHFTKRVKNLCIVVIWVYKEVFANEDKFCVTCNTKTQFSLRKCLFLIIFCFNLK